MAAVPDPPKVIEAFHVKSPHRRIVPQESTVWRKIVPTDAEIVQECLSRPFKEEAQLPVPVAVGRPLGLFVSRLGDGRLPYVHSKVYLTHLHCESFYGRMITKKKRKLGVLRAAARWSRESGCHLRGGQDGNYPFRTRPPDGGTTRSPLHFLGKVVEAQEKVKILI